MARQEFKLGKATVTRRGMTDHAPFVWEFIDTEGNKRVVEDDDGNVQRMIEAVQNGSGTAPLENQRHNYTADDGLAQTNLRRVMAGEGQPQ